MLFHLSHKFQKFLTFSFFKRKIQKEQLDNMFGIVQKNP